MRFMQTLIFISSTTRSQPSTPMCLKHDLLSFLDIFNIDQHLFRHVVEGYLKDKTVIIVTNQLQYLLQASNVVFIQNGTIAGQGRFDKLLRKNDDFRDTMIKYGMFEEDKKDKKRGPVGKAGAPGVKGPAEKKTADEVAKPQSMKETDEEKAMKGVLIETEAREVRSSRFSVLDAVFIRHYFHLIHV